MEYIDIVLLKVKKTTFGAKSETCMQSGCSNKAVELKWGNWLISSLQQDFGVLEGFK